MAMDNGKLIPPQGAVVVGLDLRSYQRRNRVSCQKARLQCPSCLKGELCATGMQTSAGVGQTALYQHRCVCGYEIVIAGESFPRIEFKDEPTKGEERGAIPSGDGRADAGLG